MDEALLECCEAGQGEEVLRLWEPTHYFVVLGYANRVAAEVNLPFCRQQNIPVLRRCTGGGTVLQGPGCLNYSLVLRIRRPAALESIPATNDFILGRHQQTLAVLVKGSVEKKGHTDLAFGGLKFSGNAQRRLRQFLLFHGSFLLNLDLKLVEQTLPMPSKQPDYRAGRAHRDFLTNLALPSPVLKAALARTWAAHNPMTGVPAEQIQRLVREKYKREEWNLKF